MHLSARTRSSSGGFTLIEIVVVLTIIAILSSIAIAGYRGVQTKAEAARIATQLHYIEDAVIEAIISGAEVWQFGSIEAGNVEQSVLSDFVTVANFTDLPPGIEISIRSQYAGDQSNPAAFLVIVEVLDDRDSGILQELVGMFPPHTAPDVAGSDIWIAIDSRSLALAPDSLIA